MNLTGGTLRLNHSLALGDAGAQGAITLSPSTVLDLRTDGPFPANFGSDVVVLDNAAATAATISTSRLTTGTSGAFQLGALTIGNATLINNGSDGSLEFTGAVALLGNATFSAQRDVMLSGSISGTGSLTKTGPGTMTLGSGASDTSPNSYGSLTTISQGVLQLNKATGTFAIPGDVSITGGTLTLLRPGQLSPAATILQSAGLVDVNGQSTTISNLNVSGGTATIHNGGSITVGNTTVSGGHLEVGSATFAAASTVTTSQFSEGSGTTVVFPNSSLVVGQQGMFITSSSPTIELVANATAPGKVVLNGDISCTSASGTSQIFASGAPPIAGTIDLRVGAVRVFTVSSNGATLLLDSVRLTDGGVRKSGVGVLKMTGSSDYSGGTTIAGGAIEADGAAALGTGPVTFAGGNLNLRSDAAMSSFPNVLSVGAANSMTFDVNRIDPGAANTFHFGSTTFGSSLVVSGQGTLQFAGATLANDLIVNNLGTSTDFDGAVSGNFALTNAAGSLMLKADRPRIPTPA